MVNFSGVIVWYYIFMITLQYYKGILVSFSIITIIEDSLSMAYYANLDDKCLNLVIKGVQFRHTWFWKTEPWLKSTYWVQTLIMYVPVALQQEGCTHSIYGYIIILKLVFSEWGRLVVAAWPDNGMTVLTVDTSQKWCLVSGLYRRKSINVLAL